MSKLQIAQKQFGVTMRVVYVAIIYDFQFFSYSMLFHVLDHSNILFYNG